MVESNYCQLDAESGKIPAPYLQHPYLHLKLVRSKNAKCESPITVCKLHFWVNYAFMKGHVY